MNKCNYSLQLENKITYFYKYKNNYNVIFI